MQVKDFIYFILAGLGGGVLAGMGMGGGTLTMPILVLIMGVGQHTAQFANLIAFLPSGAVALVMHIKNGLVKAKEIWSLLIFAIIACVAVSIFAMQVKEELLKQLFGGFLILVAILSLVGKLKES